MNLRRANRRFDLSAMETVSLASLPRGLVDLLEEGFVQQDQCIFLFGMLRKSQTIHADQFSDRTGYECFVNHLHVEDFTSADYLNVGICFLRRLAERLQQQFSTLKFRGLISTDGASTTVRFHLHREQEEWLADDLEEYREEGVAEFEF